MLLWNFLELLELFGKDFAFFCLLACVCMCSVAFGYVCACMEVSCLLQGAVHLDFETGSFTSLELIKEVMLAVQGAPHVCPPLFLKLWDYKHILQFLAFLMWVIKNELRPLCLLSKHSHTAISRSYVIFPKSTISTSILYWWCISIKIFCHPNGQVSR